MSFSWIFLSVKYFIKPFDSSLYFTLLFLSKNLFGVLPVKIDVLEYDVIDGKIEKDSSSLILNEFKYVLR